MSTICPDCPNAGHRYCCHDVPSQTTGYRVGDVHPTTKTNELASAHDDHLRRIIEQGPAFVADNTGDEA